jgi:hypothetical protein
MRVKEYDFTKPTTPSNRGGRPIRDAPLITPSPRIASTGEGRGNDFKSESSI